VASRIKDVDGGSISAGSGGPLEGIRAGKPVGSATSGPASGPTPDSVHITSSARALAALSQAVQAAPDVDGARVAGVQQALAAGQYGIDPDRIAGRMLQLEQDLGGTQS